MFEMGQSALGDVVRHMPDPAGHVPPDQLVDGRGVLLLLRLLTGDGLGRRCRDGPSQITIGHVEAEDVGTDIR